MGPQGAVVEKQCNNEMCMKRCTTQRLKSTFWREKKIFCTTQVLVLGLKQFLAFETNNVKCCSSKINFLWILAHFSLICCQHLMTITIHLMTITIQKRQPIWGSRSQFKYAQAQQYHSQSHRNEQTHNLNKWYYNLFVWNIRFEFVC